VAKKKDKKTLLGVSSVDAADRAALSDTYVPNPNQKPIKRTRRIIPGTTRTSETPEGQVNIEQIAPKVGGTVAHINNALIKRTSGMTCQVGGGHNVGAVGSSGGAGVCDYPATHYIRDTERPRGSVIGVCTQHKAKIEHEAIKAGRQPGDLEVGRLTPTNVGEIKLVQAQEAEKSNLKAAGALYMQGLVNETDENGNKVTIETLPKEDALALNMGKTPGRPVHRPARNNGGTVINVSSTSLMRPEEAEEYEGARKEANKGRVSPISSIDIDKRWRPDSETTVKMGNTAPKVDDEDAPLGEGSGVIDEVLRRYRSGDQSWSNLAKEHNIHPDLLSGSLPSPYSRRLNTSESDKLLFTPEPERRDKATENVGADQAEQVVIAYNQNKLAAKQRAIQQRRMMLPGNTPGKGLPMRRNTPFELGQGENKGIEGPKE